MKILSIETSCDETGICILDVPAHGGQKETDEDIVLLGNALASQIDIHAQYGGVFPTLAKRAHVEKIVPLLWEALKQSGLLLANQTSVGTNNHDTILALCTKDIALAEHLENFLNEYQKPDIDYIAVTVGPGLEPALWVGVNTARVLGSIWDIPIIPINHMEGHVVTALLSPVESDKLKVYKIEQVQLPILSLLVSGGHTELVLSENFGKYKKIGQTRDDAVGEAFDKVARMLGLPYPGGPAISALAAEHRCLEVKPQDKLFALPRPMLHSGDYDFSFSGLKTAVLYLLRDLKLKENYSNILENTRIVSQIATEFEDAAIEVLVKKTIRASKEYHISTIIIGGGVAANKHLREQLQKAVRQDLAKTTLLFPEPWLATDNAVMIGLAAVTRIQNGKIKKTIPESLKADGNLSL